MKFLFFVLVSFSVFLLPGRADVDAVSNLGTTARAPFVLDAAGKSAAQAFETGDTAAPLRSVTLRLSHFAGGGASSTARVRIWTGADGVPETLLEDFGILGGIDSTDPADFSIDSTTHPVLEANTRYWISVTNETGDFDWLNTNDETVTGAGSVPAERADSSTGLEASWSALGAGGATRQILAVEVYAPQTFSADSTADSGPGSIRQAIESANDHPGLDAIVVDPTLGGETVVLTSGPIAVTDDLEIDASALSVGPTFSGNSDGDGILEAEESRVLEIGSGVETTLRNVKLVDGQAATSGSGEDAAGGAILNMGSLVLEDCEISGSHAARGGGLANLAGATVTLSRVTFSGNAAVDSGGAIHNAGFLNLEQCTLAGNLANGNGGGGGIANATGAVLTVNQSTIALNRTTNAPVNGGGGIFSEGTVSVIASIVARNETAGGPGPDIRRKGGSVFGVGVNFIGDVSEATLVEGPAVLTGDPLLGALGDNGGLVNTMAPLTGSPVIDPAGGSTVAPFATDQRDAARLVGNTVDLGSVEDEIGFIPPEVVDPPTVVAGHPAIVTKKTVKAKRPSAKIRGSATGATRVEFKVAGQKGIKRARGSMSKWLAKVKGLKRRKTSVIVYAHSPTGQMTKAKVRVKMIGRKR